MSITEIQFSVIDCNPKTFDFSDCYFKIISHDTKFDNTISYLQKNSITDKTELKSDIKYCIKVMTKGEIIGIGSFILPKRTFDKKLKHIKYNNINLTLSHSILNKYFKIPIQQKQFQISITLDVNIKYITKKSKFKKINSIIKSIPITHRFHSPSKIKLEINNIYLPLTSRSNKSSKKNNSFYKLKRDYILGNNSFIKKELLFTQRHSLLNSFEKVHSDSDKTIIDSIIVDNEDDSFEDNDILKEKLNFNKDENIADNEIQDKINSVYKDLYNIIQEKNNKLQECIVNNIKLGKSYNNYNQKIRVVRKKDNNLNKLKEKYKIKNDVYVYQNDNINRIIEKSLEIKKIEVDLIDKIFDNNPDIIFSSLNSEIIKNLLIKTIRNNLDLYIDLGEYFSDEGIQIFREICKKYNLIYDGNSFQIDEDPNE